MSNTPAILEKRIYTAVATATGGREGHAPELPRDKAEALVAAAHQMCPYSNATRGNIVVDLKLA